MQDEDMWRMGLYVQSAVSVAVEHNLAGRKAKSQYVKEPLLETAEKKNKKMTQDEIEQQRLLFISKMNVMKANFEISRKVGREQ